MPSFKRGSSLIALLLVPFDPIRLYMYTGPSVISLPLSPRVVQTCATRVVGNVENNKARGDDPERTRRERHDIGQHMYCGRPTFIPA